MHILYHGDTLVLTFDGDFSSPVIVKVTKQHIFPVAPIAN